MVVGTFGREERLGASKAHRSSLQPASVILPDMYIGCLEYAHTYLPPWIFCPKPPPKKKNPRVLLFKGFFAPLPYVVVCPPLVRGKGGGKALGVVIPNSIPPNFLLFGRGTLFGVDSKDPVASLDASKAFFIEKGPRTRVDTQAYSSESWALCTTYKRSVCLLHIRYRRIFLVVPRTHAREWNGGHHTSLFLQYLFKYCPWVTSLKMTWQSPSLKSCVGVSCDGMLVCVVCVSSVLRLCLTDTSWRGR